ncbi:MAG: restriction endonuclease subunit S, partial [Bacteroidaceae bacterium]|nr:restriction endonuclease subunit S [Bacteroidaceae bacterium]
MPFELPYGWEWTTLGEVLSVKSGDNIKVRDNKEGQYPIYGGNGINGYYQHFNVEANTIAIGRVGFNCGSVHITESKSWVTDNAFIVSCEKVFEIRFLLQLLRWLDLGKTSNSTAQPVISGKGIYPLRFPLPPLAEQQRIVNAIEQWFALIDTLETARVDLQTTIVQAKSKILDLAIHGMLVTQDPNDEPAIELLKRINPNFSPCDNAHCPYDIPENWYWCKLIDLCSFLSRGKSPTYSEERKYPVFAQ